jgi:hypothetical protein
MAEIRKLAAILCSDVVGYSRLAGADEDRRYSSRAIPLPKHPQQHNGATSMGGMSRNSAEALDRTSSCRALKTWTYYTPPLGTNKINNLFEW